MSRDPEKFGRTDSIDAISEDLDDMVVQAGTSPRQLKILMYFFKEMFEIAKPFTDLETKKIKAPNGLLPIQGIDSRVIKTVNAIDGAFVESMQSCEWISIFADGYKNCKKKLKESHGWSEQMK